MMNTLDQLMLALDCETVTPRGGYTINQKHGSSVITFFDADNRYVGTCTITRPAGLAAETQFTVDIGEI